MDWGDLGLRLVRATGAIASALAGIAALLTDGAFKNKALPPSGRWKEFPFAKYQVTRWGATLLAVILIAPTVQFVGDWVKDAQDSKTLQATVEKLRKDVNSTVADSTAQSRSDIEQTVRTASEMQLSAEKRVLSEQQSITAQTSRIATGANQILDGVERVINHFDEFTVDVIYEYPVKDSLPGMKRLTAIFDTLIKENSAKDIRKWPEGLGLRGKGNMTSFWGLSLRTTSYLTAIHGLDLTRDSDFDMAAYFMNFADPGLAIAFTKFPHPVNSIKPDLFDNLEQADLVGRSSDEPKSPDEPPHWPEMSYSQRSGRIFIELRGNRFVSKDWMRNGQFGATNDLGGAYIYLMADDKLYRQQNDKKHLLAHLRPIWVSIFVSNLRVVITDFKKVGDLPIYVAQLPKNKTIFEGQSWARTPDIDAKMRSP